MPNRPAAGVHPRSAPTRSAPTVRHLFEPSPARPLRAKSTRLGPGAQVTPHSHSWGQLTFSATGVLRLSAGDSTYIVPPSRAVWVPADMEHAVTVVEEADLRTLYVHPSVATGLLPAVPSAGEGALLPCRVLEVSNLLRALLLELDSRPDSDPAPSNEELHRERLLGALVLDELRRAAPVRLGVNLPRDKRLRALCEAMLDDPTRHDSLEAWASEAGASARTVARLFRQELQTTYVRWREQVLLAKALSMAAGHRPMSHIAHELGYASASAFTAMVRRSVGAPPSRFFSR